LIRQHHIVADRQSQLLGYESDVQCRADNTRRMYGRVEKEEGKGSRGYAVSACLPVYRAGDEQPPQIRWPSELCDGDFCSVRMAYCVYSSR
jgi:hypothetical protein